MNSAALKGRRHHPAVFPRDSVYSLCFPWTLMQIQIGLLRWSLNLTADSDAFS